MIANLYRLGNLQLGHILANLKYRNGKGVFINFDMIMAFHEMISKGCVLCLVFSVPEVLVKAQSDAPFAFTYICGISIAQVAGDHVDRVFRVALAPQPRHTTMTFFTACRARRFF